MASDGAQSQGPDRKSTDQGCSCPFSHKQGRNLAICIDGTSNQFGKLNTNVINLYRQLHKDEFQLTYYNSGIGTYATPSWRSWAYWKQVVDNKIDLGIAWNFEKIVLKAYRWLADNYRPGDRIFLFGFSRGAYQVRTLAGMIHKIGLIHKGNEEQIPFAYEIYADPKSEAPLFEQAYDMKLNSVASEKLKSYRRKVPSMTDSATQTSPSGTPSRPPSLAEWFKQTFSRDIRVHFIGVWDTVSSIGVVRGKNLPGTISPEHICYFRHALALDERRVKFLPEYVRGGVLEPEERPNLTGRSVSSPVTAQGEQEIKNGDNISTKEAQPVDDRKSLTIPHIKETWFTGTHSDVGGKNGLRPDLDHSIAPLLWMSYEAMAAGLAMNVPKEWKWQEWDSVNESLTGVWKVFEYLPFTRLSYRSADDMTHRLHRGRGRKIKPGQTIHASVAFSPNRYIPKASLPTGDKPRDWRDLIKSRGKAQFVCPEGWEGLLEMDIFDVSTANTIVENLTNRDVDAALSVHRLTVLTWSGGGRSALCEVPDAPNRVFLALREPHIRDDVELQIQVINALIDFTDEISSITQSGSLNCLLDLLRHQKHCVTARSFLSKFCPFGIQKFLLDYCLFDDLERVVEDETLDVQSSVLATIRSILITPNMTPRANLIDNLRAMLDSNSKSSQIASLRATSEIAKYCSEETMSSDFSGLFEPLVQHIVGLDPDVQRCCYAAIDQLVKEDSSRHDLLEAGLIKATRDMLESTQEYVQQSGLDLMTSLITYDDSRRQIFEKEVCSPFPSLYRLGTWIIRHSVLECVSHFGPYDHIWWDGYDSTLGATALAIGAEDAAIVSWISDELAFPSSHLSAIFPPNLAEKATALGIPQNTEAVEPDETQMRTFESEAVARLLIPLNDEDVDARQSSLTQVSDIVQYSDGRSKLLQNNAVGLLLHLFNDKSWVIRQSSVEIISALMRYDDPRFKMFETDAIARALVLFGDEDVDVRQSAVKGISSVVRLDDVRTKLVENNTVTRLLSLFTDYSWRIRQMAVETICALMQYENSRQKLYKTDAINLIIGLFGDDDSDVRRSAVECIIAMMKLDDNLSEIPKADAYATLHRLLGDESSYKREVAIQVMTEMTSLENAWSKIYNTDGLQSFLNLFQDINPLVRQSAVQIITPMMQSDEARPRLLNLDAISRLVALCSDGESDVRYSALNAITALLQYDDARCLIFKTNLATGAFHLFTDDSWLVRQYSVRIIALMLSFGDAPSILFETKTVTSILSLFKDDDSDVQQSAVEAITAIIETHDPRSESTKADVSGQFLDLLNGEEWRVRKLCLDVIATFLRFENVKEEFMTTHVARLILQLFSDVESIVRQSALQTTTAILQTEELRAMFLATDVLSRMVTSLSDEESDVQQLAVESIAGLMHLEDFRLKLFEVKSFGPFIALFKHRSWRVRQSSLDTLTAMLQYPAPRTKFFEIDAVTHILDLFADEDIDVRNSAVGAINAIWRYEDTRSKFLESNALGQVLSQLTSNDNNARQASLTVIAHVMNIDNARARLLKTSAITRLLGLWADKDDTVRALFVKAISEMTQFADSRAKLFETNAIQHLLGLFADSVWTVQQAAIQTMTAMLPFEDARFRLLEIDILKALIPALYDEDSDVQQAALDAISTMIPYDNVRFKLLNSEAIARLIGLFVDKSWKVRMLAVNMFSTMMSFDNARLKFTETDVIARLLNMFGDDDIDVRNASMQVIVTMMPFAEFRNQMLDARVVEHLVRALQADESSRRLLGVEVVKKLATYGVFRAKLLEAKIPSVLIARFVDYDTSVQRGAFESLSQFVKHDEVARDIVVANILPAYSINMVPYSLEVDNDYAWTPWYQCVSRAAENDDCRQRLLRNGLLTIFVDMLRNPSACCRILALRAFTEFGKYVDFWHGLTEYSVVTPLVGMLRESDRLVQCSLFLAVTELVKHDSFRCKLLESSFVHCLVMTLSRIASEGLPSQLPEFSTPLSACIAELWAHDDSKEQMTEWQYTPSMLDPLRVT